jgi:hypothetical protein
MRKMKRLFKVLLLVLTLTITTKAYAASGNITVSSGSVYVGDSFTVSVNVSGAAAWNVHVDADGPVVKNGCSINQADATADATDTNKTFTANCVTTGEGTVVVSLSGDVTSASDGNAVSISGSKSVTVVKKAEPTPTPTPDNNNNNNNNNQDNKQEEKKSNNAKVKAIAVDGYELVKVDDNNYTLSVDNKVEKINIQVAAEDAKSTVTGSGEKELKVGENTIEIIVQAEDGTQNKITIKVTREKEEKKVTPSKKDDTKEDTKKESSTKDLKVTILLIILFVLDLVLAATVILLAIQNNKLRKNRY